MSLEANKQIVRRMIEEDLNTENRAIAYELFAPEFYDPTNPPGMQHGIESHIQVVTLFRNAFPDVRWTIENTVAEGDQVMVRLVARGTHRGTDFLGIPPSGRQFTYEGHHVLRIQNGKIVEHRGTDDNLNFLIQLGAVADPMAAH